jgi:leucine-zipper of insertion element IS481
MDIHHNARLTPRGRADLVRRVLHAGQAPEAVATDLGVDVKDMALHAAHRRQGRRFIQTASREWLDRKPYASSAARAADPSAWLRWHHRPRAATPACGLSNLLGSN